MRIQWDQLHRGAGRRLVASSIDEVFEANAASTRGCGEPNNAHQLSCARTCRMQTAKSSLCVNVG